MNKGYYYTLFAQRRGCYLTFLTLEELRNALRSFLSSKDVANGAIERLITFDARRGDGCVIKSCGGVSVCRYRLTGGISK